MTAKGDKDTVGVKFRRLWPFYVWQSALAAGILAVLSLLLGAERTVLISTMGATTLILFAMPKAVSAQTSHVIGGHLVGFASGAALYFVAIPYYLQFPLAVGVTIFLMVALDVEHPPAVGTTVAVLINEVAPDTFVVIMTSAIVLTQVRYYLRRYLRDLV